MVKELRPYISRQKVWVAYVLFLSLVAIVPPISFVSAEQLANSKVMAASSLDEAVKLLERRFKEACRGKGSATYAWTLQGVNDYDEGRKRCKEVSAECRGTCNGLDPTTGRDRDDVGDCSDLCVQQYSCCIQQNSMKNPP